MEAKQPNKPIPLLIDMDGVLADYYGHFLKVWRLTYPKRVWYPEEALTSFWIEDFYPKEYHDDIRRITTSRGFFLGIPPIPGAVEALTKIIKDPAFTPYICTSPELECVGQCCFSEKARWVEVVLGHDWLKRLVLAKDKTVMHGAYLIDDKPEIKGAMEPSWKQIVFPHEYNRNTPGLRLDGGWNGWDTLREKLIC